MRSIAIDLLYLRYRRLVEKLPTRLRWLALVCAPAGISASVLLFGLMSLAGSLTVVVGVGRVASGDTSMSVALLLALAFFAESLGYWVKERQESLLVACVRQLIYRRFRRIVSQGPAAAGARDHVLTYPAQISQFAYIVDALVSVVQVAAFLVVTLVLFGASGAAAALVIGVLVVISVRLIHRIGRLWERYVALEGRRRRWVQRVADALPRARSYPSWSTALDTITGIRAQEEHLLRTRVQLQVLNGFLDRGALTTTLAVIAVVSVWLWPGSPAGVGIILAARYLYAAAQNIIVDYRVIRLGIPMMHELDSLERAHRRLEGAEGRVTPPTSAAEVVPPGSERARALRGSVLAPGTAFVPRDPELPQPVLREWQTVSAPSRMSRFRSIAEEMGLSPEVVDRFWRETDTLSSGERHRAAVALVLSEEPDWVILDDTFAALDPRTREVVAETILEHVPACTLLAGSQEYVPQALASRSRSSAVGPQRLTLDVDTGGEPGSGASPETEELPDPVPGRATFRRTVQLLFGVQVVWVAVGALLLSGAEVAFAMTLAQARTVSAPSSVIAAVCALAAIAGSILFFVPLYRAPISRLGSLHSVLVGRIDRYASPRNSGAVVARLGEDFSALQMSVPGAVGEVFLVVVHTVMLVGGAVVGAPLYILVVLAVVPLAFVAMRRGSQWILPATTAAANRRGDFIGVVGVQAGVRTVPVSRGLRVAGECVYSSAEAAYLRASVQLANAYALRTGLIQLLVLALNVSAVALVLTIEGGSPTVTRAAVLYFATTLAAGVQSLVDTLHDVGVVGLTAERVRALEQHEKWRVEVPARLTALAQVEQALSSGNGTVALIGATGSGKSVLLDAMYRRRPDGEATIIPEADPFAPEETRASGLELARRTMRQGSQRLVLLDETLKSLSPEQERDEIETLGLSAQSGGKQAVIVLHSRSNLGCFDTVVSLDD